MMQAGSPSTYDLHRILQGAQLPALPQSAIRLLELSQDPVNGAAAFAIPIEADPGLTGQVLRFVNSSYFGFSREISSVKLAITLVGIRTIKNFTLWSAVFSLVPNPKCGELDLKSLWQDSLRRGLFARAAGKLQGLKEAEDAFAAALLQDMAIPLLAKELPNEYAILLQHRKGGARRLSVLEKSVFGWTHADASQQMARQWSLPEEFAALMGSHAQLDALLAAPDTRPDALAVGLSALLPSAVDPSWLECAHFEECYERIRPPAGPAVGEMLAQVDQDFAAFAPVLRLAAPAKSLADCYREMVAPQSL
ncbi:MAG: HDOD domain-containing protein [Pirellulales bacterium]